MLYRASRISILFLMFSAVLFLSGCAPSNTAVAPERAGIWNNFIYSISDALDWFAAHLWGQYGLAILVVTVIIRLCILPLNIKQYKSMKKMQELQPEMNKLKEKHKDDPKKQQEEMMKLFQENQVNPLGGCFPLIIQMPFIYALYMAISPQTLYNAQVGAHKFLWTTLGQPDPFYVLAILAALTTAIQQLMMMAQNTNQQSQVQMRIMLVVFPVMIFVMSMNFPAALPLYWVYTNLFTIIQNYFLYGGSKSNTELKGGLAK